MVSFGLGSFLSVEFVGMLTIYYVTTCVYTFGVKRYVLLDVLVLTTLYVMRLFAGGGAAGVPVSDWLLVFSLLFFLNLALLKRYTEINALKNGTSMNNFPDKYWPVIDALLLLI